MMESLPRVSATVKTISDANAIMKPFLRMVGGISDCWSLIFIFTFLHLRKERKFRARRSESKYLVSIPAEIIICD